MTDDPPDPALDFSVEGMMGLAARPAAPVDPVRQAWLERRALGFGGSDVPALLLAMKVRKPSPSDPSYLTRAAARLLASKAGIRVEGDATSDRMRLGMEREPELFDRFRVRLGLTTHEGPWDALWNPRSIRHASEVWPQESLPLVDRYQPRIAVTPDGYLRTYSGRLVAIEAKCSTYDGAECPWYWQVQVQAVMAVLGASEGCVLLGPGWSVGRMDAPRWWAIERDEAAIATIRATAGEAWRRVEGLRARRGERG